MFSIIIPFTELIEMIICTSLQADNPTNTLSLGLYKPNALPDPNKQSNTLGKSLLVLDWEIHEHSFEICVHLF